MPIIWRLFFDSEKTNTPKLQWNNFDTIISNWKWLVIYCGDYAMNFKKNTAYSSRTADKFVVRLPDGMRDRIAEVAREQHRSMNSEIIARLESSLQQDGVLIQDNSLRIDSPELNHHERELLQRFRLLAQRQQNALLALIANDIQDESW